MKYSILGFSQQKAVELGIGIDELIVLRWFVDFAGTNKMKVEFIDEKVYYWVNYQTIVDSLPVLRLQKQALRKKVFKNLCDAEVLIHKTIRKGGIFSYYAYGLNYDKLIYLEDSEVQTYPRVGYKHTQGLGINVPNKDSSINNSSINNNLSCPNESDDSGFDEKEKEPKEIPKEVFLENGEVDLSAISVNNFERIYNEYPKKGAKNKAFARYMKVRKGFNDATGRKVVLSNKQIYNAVISYVDQQKEANKELSYYKNFDTFMNNIIDFVVEE